MKKSERFRTLIDLQARQEEKALQALGRCRQQQRDLEGQLESLRDYRREYAEKFGAAESRGLSVGRLLEYRAFLDKLDKAIEAQQESLQSKNSELQHFRRNWEQNRSKSENLQKIDERTRKEEARRADRREQDEQDERASRSGRKNGMGPA